MIGQAILLGCIAFIAQSEYALGTSLLSRPIVTGLFVGIVLGDVKTGVIMGATLELAFIGSFSVGASIPPDVVTGGILGTAFAITAGAGTETALVLGLPIATLTLILKNIYLGLLIPIMSQKADQYAEEGAYKGVERMHLLAGFGLSFMLALIVTISFAVGSNTIKGLLDLIPEFIQHGLSVATGIIPALGFAMLARLLINKQVAPYFFLGFVLMAYFKLPVTFQMEFSWNYERQMNMAYVYAMIPILKKLYPQKEEMAAALKRHLAFFNTTPHIVTFILGINAAMEEENVLDENFEVGTIDSIKTSLMGPLAGLGDSFFWGTLRLIATGVGTSLALQGNVLGPILFLLIFNVPHVIVRYLLNRWGYKLGTGFLKKIQANGMMESLTLGASIIGLMVVGAMTASMIDLTIPITISGSGKNAVTVQSIFDDIMPKLLPLASFGFVFYLLKKEVKPLAILGGMAIVGILGSLIGLF